MLGQADEGDGTLMLRKSSWFLCRNCGCFQIEMIKESTLYSNVNNEVCLDELY